MPKKSWGFAHLALVAIVGAVLLGGIAIVVVSRSGKSLTLPGLSPSQPSKTSPEKPSGQRVTGRAKVPAPGEGIDTPRYEDNLTSLPVSKDGGVVAMTLKNGVKAYLTIPPDTLSGNFAELSEFRELPTSETHVPLYTDLGFGVNVAFTDLPKGLLNPVFLVFDFSQGKVLEEFKKLDQSLINYCDFSTYYFSPEICAQLIGLPAEKTLGGKYIAVSPKYAADDRTPTFPVYSHFLGTDDLLVLEIDLYNEESVVVIPQPITRELAADLVKSTFAKYAVEYEEYEAFDLARNLNLELTDEGLVWEMISELSFYELKTYYANKYLVNQTKNPQDLERVRKRDTESAGLLLSHLSKSVGETVQESGRAATLKRATKGGIPGAKEAERLVLQELVANLKDGIFQDDELVHAVESVFILTGGLSYTKEPHAQGPFDFLIKPVLAQQTDEEKEAERVAREAAIKEINDIIDPERTPSDADLTRALELADKLKDPELTKKVIERIEEVIDKEIDNAKDDIEKRKAAGRCALWGMEDNKDPKTGGPSKCRKLLDEVMSAIETECKKLFEENLDPLIYKTLKTFGMNNVEFRELCINVLFKSAFDLAREKGYPLPAEPKLPPFPNQ